MVYIFDQRNKLNLNMQGKNANIIQFKDTLKTFMGKLDNWKRKDRTNNLAMFKKLSSILKVDDKEHILCDLKKN